MIVAKRAPAYNFYGNTDTGLTLRWGKTMEENPLRAPWPELADISISNHCTKGCGFCYRGSGDNGSFMPLESYESVLDALTSPVYGSVFQVALGGGEPLEHPAFLDILKATAERGIAANFTTNGELVDRSLAAALDGLVGAAAISTNWMSGYDPRKAVVLADSGIKVNLHFVLSKESLQDAIGLLEGKFNRLLEGVNGVVFLTYKPKGRALAQSCLSMNDSRFKEFISKISLNSCRAKIGFDACFVPLLLRYTSVDADYVDSCECGFFSIYIDELGNASPCSFANDGRYRFNLSAYSMNQIWNNCFEAYREEMLSVKCADEICANAEHCRGKCSFYEQISFCCT
ncbi:MAG: radical SAM protein [Clostridiales bacterium]|jgi:MoaA/NifB/PqqE/SkfB family radical SAM enzyme|nr:radical SAM protein [Clostridiales bacterium]